MKGMRRGDYATMFTTCRGMGGDLGVVDGSDSVAFDSKTKPKLEKRVMLSTGRLTIARAINQR